MTGYPTGVQIKSIAGEIDAGLTAYFHKQNGEVISIPKELDGFDGLEDEWQDELNKVEADEEAYIVVEPMTSIDSFRIMEKFARLIDDRVLQDRLFAALSKRKPFQGFKFIIDNTEHYRQKWFDFKDMQLFNYVKRHFDVDDDNDE